MHTSLLSLALCLSPALPDQTPLPVPVVAQPAPPRYPNLPCEKECELAYCKACGEVNALNQRLNQGPLAGGWHLRQLLWAREEAEWRLQVHLALWWLQWPTATAGELLQWEETFRDLGGDEALLQR